jgi:hypothetical protein
MAIVAASGNGSAPSTAANRKNDGGTIVGAGNISTATGVSAPPITNDLSINTLADNVGAGIIGSKMVQNVGTGAATTDRAGVMRARTTATGGFAFTPSGNSDVTRSETFIIHGFTTAIGATANTAVQGGKRVGDGIAALAYPITHSNLGTSGTYDMYARPSTDITPNFTKGAGAGTTTTYQNTTDTTVAVTGEIFPTRAVPGELTYHFGGLGKPTTDEYKAKDDFETETGSSS